MDTTRFLFRKNRIIPSAVMRGKNREESWGYGNYTLSLRETGGICPFHELLLWLEIQLLPCGSILLMSLSQNQYNAEMGVAMLVSIMD